MRSIIFFALMLPFFGSAQEQRVLFIGNSYTQYNNLPTMVRLLALSGGDSLFTDMNAPGGFTFQGHTTNSTTLSKIALGNWDYVVLQEQSQIPSFPPSQVETQCYPYARALDSLVRISNSCTETVFYMTWGRKYGDAANCSFYPVVCTFNGMQSRLRSSYLEMGSDNNSTVAPAGQAWKLCRERDSTIELYQSDNSHPSVEGSYLTACVFYATILRKTPVGLSYLAGLSSQTAGFLQQVAHDVVLDSVATWRLYSDRPIAETQFSSTGLSLDLLDLSQNSTSNQWIIEGQNYTGTSASHTFSGNGIYTVSQMVSNACFSDSIAFTVQIGPTNLDELSGDVFRLFPNPAENFLQFSPAEYAAFEILDLSGKQISTGFTNGIISIESLETGVYFLQLTTSGNVRKSKLFIKN